MVILLQRIRCLALTTDANHCQACEPQRYATHNIDSRRTSHGTARPALSVLRSALASSPCAVEDARCGLLLCCSPFTNTNASVILVFNTPLHKTTIYITSHPLPLLIDGDHTPAQNHSDTPRSSSTHDERATPTARSVLFVLR